VDPAARRHRGAAVERLGVNAIVFSTTEHAVRGDRKGISVIDVATRTVRNTLQRTARCE
jgi:predicted transcriptional regulator